MAAALVQLLKPQAAAELVKESHHLRYVQRVSSSKENVRRRTWHDFDSYVAHFIPWHDEQQGALQRAVDTVVRSVVPRRWAWLVDPDLSWSFILAKDQFEAGMPHTIHTAVVIPEWMARAALADPHNRTLLDNLVHERVHVLQKARPEPWAKLYEGWGWTNEQHLKSDSMWASLSESVKAAGFSGVKFPQNRINPDTPHAWVMRQREPEEVLWVPFTPFVTAGRTLNQVAHGFLRVHHGEPTSKAYGSAQWRPKETVGWFAEHIGDNASCWHCYHPEETAAVLIALDCREPELAARRVDSPARRALVRWGREVGAGELMRVHGPRGAGSRAGRGKDSVKKKPKRVHHEL